MSKKYQGLPTIAQLGSEDQRDLVRMALCVQCPEYLWMINGSYMDYLWIIYGSMDNIWFIYGFYGEFMGMVEQGNN